MKRSIRTVIAATALAGAGLLAAAPVALAYPTPTIISVSVVVNPATGITTVTITTPDGTFDPGTFISFYGVPFNANGSAVRSALLATPSHASRVSSLTFAIPANAVFLGTSKVDAAGGLTTPLSIPASLQGKIQILAVGTKAGKSVTTSTVVTVGKAALGGGSTGTGSSSGLPFTGSNDIVPLTLAGVGALALGSGAIVVARRRRTSAAPA